MTIELKFFALKNVKYFQQYCKSDLTIKRYERKKEKYYFEFNFLMKIENETFVTCIVFTQILLFLLFIGILHYLRSVLVHL